MRKLFPMLLFTLLLALLMAVPALAADFTYDDFSATLTVPDSYTMVTTSNCPPCRMISPCSTGM